MKYIELIAKKKNNQKNIFLNNLFSKFDNLFKIPDFMHYKVHLKAIVFFQRTVVFCNPEPLL